MEYVYLIFSVLVFAFFGLYVMHKIDHFLSSGDFKFYSDDEDIKEHREHKEKGKKN
jgi:hypothetical protein